MTRHVCAEIVYDTLAGPVHSDLCADADLSVGYSPGWRAGLHEALDEWLNKSNGTGIFYVGDIAGYVGGMNR